MVIAGYVRYVIGNRSNIPANTLKGAIDLLGS